MRIQSQGGDLAARVRASIRERLQAGSARKNGIASDLSLSLRSLDRELSRCGTCYREQLERARRELAEERLTETWSPLAEVSRALGYADPANFTRAFRRWTGESPRSYRKRGGAK